MTTLALRNFLNQWGTFMYFPWFYALDKCGVRKRCQIGLMWFYVIDLKSSDGQTIHQGHIFERGNRFNLSLVDWVLADFMQWQKDLIRFWSSAVPNHYLWVTLRCCEVGNGDTFLKANITLNPPMWGMKTVLLKGPLFWPFPMVPIVEGVNLYNILLRRKILPR